MKIWRLTNVSGVPRLVDYSDGSRKVIKPGGTLDLKSPLQIGVKTSMMLRRKPPILMWKVITTPDPPPEEVAEPEKEEEIVVPPVEPPKVKKIEEPPTPPAALETGDFLLKRIMREMIESGTDLTLAGKPEVAALRELAQKEEADIEVNKWHRNELFKELENKN